MEVEEEEEEEDEDEDEEEGRTAPISFQGARRTMLILVMGS